jgi:hypothetical protein
VKYKAPAVTASSLPTSPVSRLSLHDLLEALPSPILRRLSSNNESCAVPRYALLWAARVGGLLQQAAVQGSAPYVSSKLIATCGCKDSDSPCDSWDQQLQR